LNGTIPSSFGNLLNLSSLYHFPFLVEFLKF
jgi:hypothetical protein